MRLIRLLLLGAGVAYLYKRFVVDPGAGREETQAAEPYSSDQGTEDSRPAAEQTSGSEPTSEPAELRDTIERPTWLKPADSEEPAGSDGPADSGA